MSYGVPVRGAVSLVTGGTGTFLRVDGQTLRNVDTDSSRGLVYSLPHGTTSWSGPCAQSTEVPRVLSDSPRPFLFRHLSNHTVSDTYDTDLQQVVRPGVGEGWSRSPRRPALSFVSQRRSPGPPACCRGRGPLGYRRTVTHVFEFRTREADFRPVGRPSEGRDRSTGCLVKETFDPVVLGRSPRWGPFG